MQTPLYNCSPSYIFDYPIYCDIGYPLGDREKTMGKLLRNDKGVSTAIASTVMIGTTIACMLAAISYAQTCINIHHEQIGERLCIEKVFFNSSTISIYARNVGYGDVTIQFVRVNGRRHNLTEGCTFPKDSEVRLLTVEDYEVSSDGVYRIELVSSRRNSFETEVKYP